MRLEAGGGSVAVFFVKSAPLSVVSTGKSAERGTDPFVVVFDNNERCWYHLQHERESR
jgi:hypothetical protein